MNPTTLFELLQLVVGLIGSVFGGPKVDQASYFVLIAQKAAAAYEAEVGQPLDLSKLTHEDPIP